MGLKNTKISGIPYFVICLESWWFVGANYWWIQI